MANDHNPHQTRRRTASLASLEHSYLSDASEYSCRSAQSAPVPAENSDVRLGDAVKVFSKTSNRWLCGEVVSPEKEDGPFIVEYKIKGKPCRKPLAFGSPNMKVLVDKRSTVPMNIVDTGCLPADSSALPPDSNIAKPSCQDPTTNAPSYLSLNAPPLQGQCYAGIYEIALHSDPKERRPLWKSLTGEFWIYYGTDGCWHLGDADEKEKDFDACSGYIHSCETQKFPSDLARGEWFEDRKGQRRANNSISVERLALDSLQTLACNDNRNDAKILEEIRSALEKGLPEEVIDNRFFPMQIYVECREALFSGKYTLKTRGEELCWLKANALEDTIEFVPSPSITTAFRFKVGDRVQSKFDRTRHKKGQILTCVGIEQDEFGGACVELEVDDLCSKIVLEVDDLCSKIMVDYKTQEFEPVFQPGSYEILTDDLSLLDASGIELLKGNFIDVVEIAHLEDGRVRGRVDATTEIWITLSGQKGNTDLAIRRVRPQLHRCSESKWRVGFRPQQNQYPSLKAAIVPSTVPAFPGVVLADAGKESCWKNNDGSRCTITSKRMARSALHCSNGGSFDELDAATKLGEIAKLLPEELADYVKAKQEAFDKEKQQTINDVSSRGISLRHMLQFHAKMQKHHNNPEATTHTVVTEMAAEYTREESCSVATKIKKTNKSTDDGGGPVYHVVHSWDMKHSDVLIGLVYFMSGSKTRSLKVEEIEKHLGSDAAVLDKEMFFCGHCINQHVSCDAVTKDYLKSDHPRCETVLFEEVAKSIHQRGGSMIVTLDEEFRLLKRIWCLDEIHEALERGMPLHFTMSKIAALKKEHFKDVRKCQASREDDKERILKKIENPDEFNKKVQTAIKEKITELRMRASKEDLAEENEINIFKQLSNLEAKVNDLSEDKIRLEAKLDKLQMDFEQERSSKKTMKMSLLDLSAASPKENRTSFTARYQSSEGHVRVRTPMDEQSLVNLLH